MASGKFIKVALVNVPRYFLVKKNVGMIPVESNLELAYAIELERDLSVVSYRTQALKVQLSQCESNYPDFLVKYSDGRVEVHEVKADKLNLTEKKRQETSSN
ncbi:hypothetical protein [Acinetobacter seifertii]|uniref:hypothetical protein n=1 Tax=Acinetobacter seifertii TaxID=1530123 RepID=UPI00321A529D